MNDTRLEQDSMGSVAVPHDALYGAQTQRAVNNFSYQHNNMLMPKDFIHALALIKAACAHANYKEKLLSAEKMQQIIAATEKITTENYMQQFPISVFQTGSGTSSNMNMNEVITHIAAQQNIMLHPNDDVNMSQSSNDTIPTAIHVSAALTVTNNLLPALHHLSKTIANKAHQVAHIVKTGRTHLMDAVPIRFDQELSGWQQQIKNSIIRMENLLPRLQQLAQGGTAIGTGLNTPPNFSQNVCDYLTQISNIKFTVKENYFEGISCQDTAVELSGQCRVLAVALMKIANDLRWMNSGPLSGLSEISLKALQPGSSIMPGKINPVIPEAVAMIATQIIGYDSAITIAGQSGNFQLNVMLPLIGFNLLNIIHLATDASRILANKAIADFTVNENNIKQQLYKNPILITALNTRIGYEMGSKIAKKAYAEQRSVIEVATEMTNLSASEIEDLLNPINLTK